MLLIRGGPRELALALFLSAGCVAEARDGSVGSAESTVTADARSMVRRPDGKFDVVCSDGRTEIATADEITHDRICAQPPQPPNGWIRNRIFRREHIGAGVQLRSRTAYFTSCVPTLAGAELRIENDTLSSDRMILGHTLRKQFPGNDGMQHCGTMLGQIRSATGFLGSLDVFADVDVSGTFSCDYKTSEIPDIDSDAWLLQHCGDVKLEGVVSDPAPSMSWGTFSLGD